MRKLRYIFLLIIFTACELKAQEVTIIPRPNQIEFGKGTFDMNKAEAIYYTGPSDYEVGYLQNSLQEKYESGAGY